MHQEIRNKNIIYTLVSQYCQDYRGRSIRSQVFSLGKWSDRNHESRRSAREHGGSIRSAESYRHLSRRNPQSLQCLLVKWVNKSSGVIHLNRSRRNCCKNAKNDPEDRKSGGSRRRAARKAVIRDLNSSDEGLSACIGQRERRKRYFHLSLSRSFSSSQDGAGER